MDLSPTALTVITLGIFIVTFPLGPSWFVAFPILFAMVALSLDKRRRRPTVDPVLPVYTPPPAGDASPPAGDAPPPVGDAPPPAGDAPPPAGDAPPPASDAPPPAGDALPPGLAVVAGGMRRRKRFNPKNAPPPAGDALPPAGDAPPPASDAPPPAGDALAPDLAVVAGGMRRRKPFDPKNAPPPASDASPPAGDAPPPASGAPPPAGDALAPDLAVVAGGMERREPGSSSMSWSYDVSSSSTSSSYQVFLSFRGPDTRKTFTDCLYSELVSKGITVFNDNEQLGDDEQPTAELNEAILRSRTCIPILSVNYASSKWCLKELVRIMECKRSYKKTILPIFYEVSPSDVRHQAGDFGRAFNLHQGVGVDSNTMETWRMALREVGILPGYSWNSYKGYESQLIEKVVLRVGRMLRDDGLAVSEKLFGVHHHIQEIMRKLGVAYSKGQATEVRGQEVRAVGLWGVKGIGKTMLAKAIYNEVHKLFESHSFLEGISLKGVRFSRQMLIADLQKGEPAPLESSDEGIKILASQFTTKRVLIVLDGVDEYQQIEKLIWKGDWFGSGSRIIVTTREKHVLKACRIVEEHEVEPMSDDHALQLFRHHAFQGDAPKEAFDPEYDSLSTDIVKAVGRVPGDIVHHASYLRRIMGVDNWRSTLELLQRHGKERQAAL